MSKTTCTRVEEAADWKVVVASPTEPPQAMLNVILPSLHKVAEVVEKTQLPPLPVIEVLAMVKPTLSRRITGVVVASGVPERLRPKVMVLPTLASVVEALLDEVVAVWSEIAAALAV